VQTDVRASSQHKRCYRFIFFTVNPLLHFIDMFTEAVLKTEEVPTEIWQIALHQIEE